MVIEAFIASRQVVNDNLTNECEEEDENDENEMDEEVEFKIDPVLVEMVSVISHVRNIFMKLIHVFED